MRFVPRGAREVTSVMTGGSELVKGLLVRVPQGPSFGRYISTGAEENLGRLDVPTAIVFELDGVEMSALELRCLAEHATAAAEWCEANRQLVRPDGQTGH